MWALWTRCWHWLARYVLARALDATSGRVEPGKVAVVVKRTVPFSGNVRALADALLAAGQYELVLYKDGPLGAAAQVWRAQGARVYEQFSLAALRDVQSAQVVVLGHSGRDAFLFRPRPGRRVINLWHGVALKRIEHLMPLDLAQRQQAKRRRLMAVNSRMYDALVASSATDRLVNALAFGVAIDKVYATGLPRFDYLAPHAVWSADMQADGQRLQAVLAGRPMVLYAPTFREHSASVLTALTPALLERLRGFLRDQNLVLGIRPHPYDQKALAALCDGQWVVDCSPNLYAEPAVLLQAAQALVVDYSSIWVDYLLLQRPMVGLVPDLAAYTAQERGFIYDLPSVFPGPLLADWSAVMAHLADLAAGNFAVPDAQLPRHQYAEHLLLPPESVRFASTAACMALFFGAS